MLRSASRPGWSVVPRMSIVLPDVTVNSALATMCCLPPS
jgi:hypothetical protein